MAKKKVTLAAGMSVVTNQDKECVIVGQKGGEWEVRFPNGMTTTYPTNKLRPKKDGEDFSKEKTPKR